MITNLAILLAKDSLLGLESNLTSKVINQFWRKIGGKKPVLAGKGFTLFISNGDMNDITKIIKSLQDSNVSIDDIK